ncbi:MAG TPA: hypothetical protein VGG11_08140 [Xanthobacteraceae bacterium]|jgi:hypothetical protein
MNIFEEELRKMAAEIARQERAGMDSASECSQIASDVSRDLVAHIGSYRPAESINVSSHANTVNVSTTHSTLEITCAAPQSFHLVDRNVDLTTQIRTQPPRPASTSGAPVDRSAMVRGVLIWLQDNGVA